MPPTCVVCGNPIDPHARTFLIECYFCIQWIHGPCAQVNERDALRVTKFACPDCRQQGHQSVQHGASLVASYVVKPFRRVNVFGQCFYWIFRNGSLACSSLSSGDIVSLTCELRQDKTKTSSAFRQLLGAAIYARSGVHVVSCQEVQPFFLQWNPLAQPVLIVGKNYQVAGLDEPFPVLDAAFVAELLAIKCIVLSTNVATQTKRHLTASTWQTRTVENQEDEEDATSLLVNAEFQLQHTRMQLQVASPVAVAQVDWRCLVLSNDDQKSSGTAATTNIFGTFLTSNVYLDFTLAPGGQCTWLSVSAGELWVYLIPPTAANWDIYREWKNDANFATTFLAERVDKCIKCVVSTGSTLLVPAGWIFARYAGGVQSCSLFHGYFACTAAMETQLGVVLMEMQHKALAQHWIETKSGWLSVDSNVQVWTAVCYYLRQLLMVNNDVSVQVSDQEWRALQRALPRLHEWSALPASLKSVNETAWTPSSLQEAQAIVDRMEQALVAINLPSHKSDELQSTTALENDSKLPPISPNEATYIYSVASVPDAVSESVLESTDFDSSNTSIFSSSALTGSMWANYDPSQQHQQQQQDDLVTPIQNQQYVNNDSSFEQRSRSQNLLGYDSANYGYLSPGGSERYMVSSGSRNDVGLKVLSHSLLDTANTLLAPTVPGTSFQQTHLDSNGNHNMLLRHRASCHRCGNLRKNNVRCPLCPHIFCAKCAEKMLEEHGDSIFDSGCPVCKELCCCGKNRTLRCSRKFHCYKKCLSTKRPAAG